MYTEYVWDLLRSCGDLWSISDMSLLPDEIFGFKKHSYNLVSEMKSSLLKKTDLGPNDLEKEDMDSTGFEPVASASRRQHSSTELRAPR